MLMKRRFLIFVNLFIENILMGLHTLFTHKLRSFLSITGISIGIFSIVMVFTLIDSLEKQIKDSLSSLGKSVVYIEVFPWETEDRKEYPWWRYMNHPDPEMKEMESIQNSFAAPIIDAIAFKMTYSFGKIVNTETGLTQTGVDIEGISHDFNKIQDIDLNMGRYFTEQESENGARVAIIGHTIAEKLFNSPENAIGKSVRLLNELVQIIGVIKFEGENVMQNSADDKVYIPVNYLSKTTGINRRSFNPRILIKAKDNISVDALALELKGVMRNVRKLKPDDEDNFAVNKVTFLIEYLRDFFKKVNLFGLIIGGFSLLVGGFGVANIMFVSVKERTGLIGIQKALGAKKNHILQQFLTESVVLCFLGGILGMIGVVLLTFVGNLFLDSSTELSFRLVISVTNIIKGMGFSVATGIIAGIVPAVFAANMPPVEAIRSN
jgi:putative ABC transport system permease protein